MRGNPKEEMQKRKIELRELCKEKNKYIERGKCRLIMVHPHVKRFYDLQRIYVNNMYLLTSAIR